MENIADYLYTIYLGIVEGLTEFLPVSSTGHLLLAEALANRNAPPAFETMIQLGAILAVCVLYFQKLSGIAIGLPNSASARRFAISVIIAFLPAMAIGYLAHDFIKSQLFNPVIVSISLIVGGIIIIIAEKLRPQPKIIEVDDIDLITSIKIGLVQCIAMVPGVSRSGATIIGGMLMGVERKAAAEFSFFLAIPTMLGVFVYEAIKYKDELLGQGGHELILVATGFVVSFVSAILVIKPFLNIVTKIGFTPFAWYRIAVGAIMLWYFLR